ncbi:MAG: IclR family transcriptional regulator [Fidelibacterota bacterium]
MVQLLNTQKSSPNLSLQNGSVIKTFQILEQFTRENPELTINDIARPTGINRSTVFRFLNSLQSLGIIERTDEGLYKLGIRLFELGIRVDVNQSIVDKAQPYLRELSNRVQESSCLSIRDRVDALCLVNEESVQNIRIDIPVGTRNPMYCTSMGKAILAFMDSEFLDLYFDITELRKRATNTITTESEVRSELNRIQSSFISYDEEEFAADVYCIGTPVFDINEHPVAAISISGLMSRIIDQKDSISEAVLYAGKMITKAIGGHYPSRYSTKIY